MKFGLENHPIKVIYISPLPNDTSEFAKKIEVVNSKSLSEINIKLDEDETTVFKHICNLKYPLHIFEAYSVL